MKGAGDLHLLAKLSHEALLVAWLHRFDHGQGALVAPLKDCLVRQAGVALHCLQCALSQVIDLLLEVAEILLGQFTFPRFRCLIKAGHRGEVVRLNCDFGRQHFEVFDFGALLVTGRRRLALVLVLVSSFVAELE